MKCNNCGHELNENSYFCQECGTKIGIPEEKISNGAKFGWGVLGFFFPIIGLILYCVWKGTKKEASKASGIGALIGFCLNILITILYFILIFVVLAGTSLS